MTIMTPLLNMFPPYQVEGRNQSPSDIGTHWQILTDEGTCNVDMAADIALQ
jgi:hypothetical protein